MAVKVSLDKKKVEQGVKCDYTEGAWIKIRPLTPKKFREFRKMCLKGFVWKKGQRVEDIDEDKLEGLSSDWLIEDWGGFVGDDNKPISCTTKNKIFMMENVAPVAAFVKHMDSEIQRGNVEREENERKNSQPTSIGRTPETKT